MGWEDLINNKPHEIYIKLDDIVSQYEATLEKELQPIKTPTEAYYREFDNFKDTYLCNSVRIDKSQLNNAIFKLTALDPINLNIDKKKLENQKLVEQLQKLDKSFTDLYVRESQIEILKQIIEHQNQLFTRIPSCQQIFNILKLTKDTAKDTRKLTSDDIYKNIISFKYLSGSSIPESLYEQYTTLFQAVWENNTELVEHMSSDLIIAIKDNNNMIPFMLAYYKGYEHMASKILKIAERQYYPKHSSDLATNIKQSFVSNYDLEDESESEPELLADIVIDEIQDAKVSVYTVTTTFELLQHANYKLSEKYELILKNWKKQDSLRGFSKVLMWAESYQKVKNDKEDMTNIVMRLIRNTTKTYAPLFKNNKNNLMQCAIFIDNVDVADLLIEYGAGGNSFGMFNIDRDDEIADIIKNLIPIYALSYPKILKKKSWISRHDPYIFDQAVDSFFLQMAAYYGAIKCIEYFLSTWPIDALQKFSSLHCKNSNIRNLFFKDEEVFKIGGVLFWFYLPKADTSFHWAVKENKPEMPRSIVKVGADPFISDECEWTALHLAATANTSIVDFAYNNYLHLSIKESSLEITKTLLIFKDQKEKVETNKKEIWRHTPVDIAINQFLKEIHDKDIFNENSIKPKEQRFVLSRLDTYLNKNESRQSISCCSKQEEVEQFQPFEVFDLLQKTNESINSQRDLIPFKDTKDMIYECISLLSDPGSYLIDKDIYAIPQINIDIYKFSD
ncbi:21169_t:CDS:10 [Gigaspora margarita]|uniref:21169_t:CDS:1 n=1 Tax=Gigaspora margarita TaxID=4874 RepID=A0ABM8VZ91_GIGMA|nr:21169_t:CDS:10 [Gigaspora margarita]